MLIVIGILGLIFIAGIFGYRYFEQKMANLMAQEVTSIDPAELANGRYRGTCDSLIIKVIVEVVVDDGAITAIDIIEHDNGQGEAAEAIIDDVIALQTTDVDSIAGATYSSQAILLAIGDALSTGSAE